MKGIEFGQGNLKEAFLELLGWVAQGGDATGS